MRIVLIMKTLALRTTLTKALLTILDWLPPDIMVRFTAAQADTRPIAINA